MSTPGVLQPVSPVQPGTCWKGLNSEHLLWGCSVLPACSMFTKLAFGGQIQLSWWCRVLCLHLSFPHCPDTWKSWGPVLKCGVVTPPPLQPLLDVTVSSCQPVMLPTALCHILGANSRENEPPRFVLFILAGFSLNIQVKQVLARLFLQPRCESQERSVSPSGGSSTGENPRGGRRSCRRSSRT